MKTIKWKICKNKIKYWERHEPKRWKIDIKIDVFKVKEIREVEEFLSHKHYIFVAAIREKKRECVNLLYIRRQKL